MPKPHRGRIQAQGEGTEKSESWAQDDPLTKEEGLALLDKLERRLTKAERQARKDQLVIDIKMSPTALAIAAVLIEYWLAGRLSAEGLARWLGEEEEAG